MTNDQIQMTNEPAGAGKLQITNNKSRNSLAVWSNRRFPRHSREGGNPDPRRTLLDARLRGHDDERTSLG
jgi:hypothetical protein